MEIFDRHVWGQSRVGESDGEISVVGYGEKAYNAVDRFP